MTEQTEGAEALAHWILANVPDWLNPVDAREFARDILTSDWLRDREAAAEVRGAQAVLTAVEAIHVPIHDKVCAACRVLALPCPTLTAARAAAAAAGGGA